MADKKYFKIGDIYGVDYKGSTIEVSGDSKKEEISKEEFDKAQERMRADRLKIVKKSKK